MAVMIWSGEKLRVIRAAEAGFPAFYRVVWNEHAAEFSDLSAADRIVCMDAVAWSSVCCASNWLRPRSTWRLSVIWWRICTGM
jgi:hypothetical protein